MARKWKVRPFDGCTEVYYFRGRILPCYIGKEIDLFGQPIVKTVFTTVGLYCWESRLCAEKQIEKEFYLADISDCGILYYKRGERPLWGKGDE